MDWEESCRKGDSRWDLVEPARPFVVLSEGERLMIGGADRVLVSGCEADHDAVAWQKAGLRFGIVSACAGGGARSVMGKE